MSSIPQLSAEGDVREATAALERSTARARGKRYRAAFDEAKTSLQDAPFWRFVKECGGVPADRWFARQVKKMPAMSTGKK